MIPASVSTSLNSLLSGVIAAYPLESASIFTLGGLQQQANDLVVTLEGLLTADDSELVSPKFSIAEQFANAIINVTSVAEEEVTLTEILALVGRAAINIATVAEPFIVEPEPALFLDGLLVEPILQPLMLSDSVFKTPGTGADGQLDFNDKTQSGLVWSMFGM